MIYVDHLHKGKLAYPHMSHAIFPLPSPRLNTNFDKSSSAAFQHVVSRNACKMRSIIKEIRLLRGLKFLLAFRIPLATRRIKYEGSERRMVQGKWARGQHPSGEISTSSAVQLQGMLRSLPGLDHPSFLPPPSRASKTSVASDRFSRAHAALRKLNRHPLHPRKSSRRPT
jgi:hypothetical protein